MPDFETLERIARVELELELAKREAAKFICGIPKELWASSPAEWIVKARSVGLGARNPYRPRGQIRYGKWITVASFPAAEWREAKARWEVEQRRRGLEDVAVFRMGKRYTEQA
jgi:hypothetical protein